MTDFLNKTASEFAQHIDNLYHGPFVKIKIKPNTEYIVSKPLLCKESPYFATMFGSKFIEGQTQTVEMEDIEGVNSSQSFPAFLQWLYHRRVRFDPVKPEAKITAAIELSRLADMFHVDRLGAEMAEYIRKLLIANPTPPTEEWEYFDTNTNVLTEQHVRSAGYLPRGNRVRSLIADASVEGFLRGDDYKFADLAREHPTFEIDFLEQVRRALTSLDDSGEDTMVKDPITGKKEWHIKKANDNHPYGGSHQGAHDNLFDITSREGSYINCQTKGLKICYLGERRQVFRVSSPGGNHYNLSAEGTEENLHRKEDDGVKLSDSNRERNEPLALLPV
ncbi:hypothetical protein PEBR_34064 [Penicillium brasilianum]|uniref:BTB domain-containing protein n=1 Tax=Penicillium brasilianum TaxID=104259 RepID=A0A1S9RFL9_PENBI|nr:hypothetical protein PEBR_34064 [Penicillium brasilianum]